MGNKPDIHPEILFRVATTLVGVIGPGIVAWHFLDWARIGRLLGVLWGACLVLGCSATDSNVPRRWIKAPIIGFLSFPLGYVFDVVILPISIFATGAFATGRIPKFRGGLWFIPVAAYVALRGAFAVGAGYLVYTLFPHSYIRHYAEGNLILNRRSCRSFIDEEIAEEDVQAILEAGRFAPSAVNIQTWSFITFTRQEWRKHFDRPIPFNDMHAMVICADMYKLKNHFSDFIETPYVNISFALFNAGLAAMNMTIAAEALGLKTIMLSETGKTGLLDFAYLKEKLGLPDGVIPLTTLVIGKAKGEKPGVPPRQPWEATVMKNTYNEKCTEMLDDWQQQMFIGFKLTHPMSNFQKQLEYYKKKMVEAEEEIKKQYQK